MADHLTEEEQIEALKNWWKEYWMSIVLPILILAAGYYGWNTYQGNKEVKAKQSSILYQEMVNLVNEPGAELAEEKKNEAKVLAQQLIEQYEGTLNADRAKLLLARFDVEQGEMASAENYLGQVVSNGSNPAIQNIAKARLAKVSIAQGNYDKAISLVAAPGESFKSLFAELRGDALAAKGDTAAANTAYQEAIDNLGQQFQRRGLIELKQKGVAILAGASSDNMSESEEASTDAVSKEGTEPEPKEQLADEGNS